MLHRKYAAGGPSEADFRENRYVWQVYVGDTAQAGRAVSTAQPVA